MTTLLEAVRRTEAPSAPLIITCLENGYQNAALELLAADAETDPTLLTRLHAATSREAVAA